MPRLPRELGVPTDETFGEYVRRLFREDPSRLSREEYGAAAREADWTRANVQLADELDSYIGDRVRLIRARVAHDDTVIPADTIFHVRARFFDRLLGVTNAIAFTTPYLLRFDWLVCNGTPISEHLAHLNLIPAKVAC